MKIQSCYRAFVLTKSFFNKKLSIIKIQSQIRQFIFRKKYLRMRDACIISQSIYRGSIYKRLFLIKKHACIKIQAICRGFVRKQIHLWIRNDIIIPLQAGVRCYFICNHYSQTEFEQENEIIIALACAKIGMCSTRFS